jgi:DNA-binding transcriptional MocR family regulator
VEAASWPARRAARLPSSGPQRSTDWIPKTKGAPEVLCRTGAEGIAELRAWFADDVGGRQGSIGQNEVLVNSGGQTALVTALRVLTDPGQAVLAESPTYPGTLAAAEAAGLRCVPIPVDEDGLSVDLLEEGFARSGARVLVCQPLFQNPTGAVLAPERRVRLMQAVHQARAFVIEDDFTRRLVHDDAPDLPQPLAADDPDGHVVHIRSLTKPTSPSLRIAAVTARGTAFERIRATHIINSFFVSRPLQETALELMTSPVYATHLRRLATTLRDRRETMTRTLSELPAPDRPRSRTRRLPPLGISARGHGRRSGHRRSIPPGRSREPRQCLLRARRTDRPSPPQLRGPVHHRRDHPGLKRLDQAVRQVL